MSRRKGKDGELWFLNHGLLDIFPDAHRNWQEQSVEGGPDFSNTPGFSIEAKYGKTYRSKMIEKILDQLDKETQEDTHGIALIKVPYKEPYALMTFETLIELLSTIKEE